MPRFFNVRAWLTVLGALLVLTIAAAALTAAARTYILDRALPLLQQDSRLLMQADGSTVTGFRH